MVDFDLLNVQQLLGDVRNDKVISETKLLNRIDKKVKNMQTTLNNLTGDNNSLQAENINLEFRVDELNEQIEELQCKKLKKVHGKKEYYNYYHDGPGKIRLEFRRI
eukprot:UN06821